MELPLHTDYSGRFSSNAWSKNMQDAGGVRMSRPDYLILCSHSIPIICNFRSPGEQSLSAQSIQTTFIRLASEKECSCVEMTKDTRIDSRENFHDMVGPVTKTGRNEFTARRPARLRQARKPKYISCAHSVPVNERPQLAERHPLGHGPRC